MLKGAKAQQDQMAGCLGKLIGSCVGLFYSTEALFKQHASFTKALFSMPKCFIFNIHTQLQSVV